MFIQQNMEKLIQISSTQGHSTSLNKKDFLKQRKYSKHIRNLSQKIQRSLADFVCFSERKLGGLEKARGLYEKALSLDAENKAALEYQGELFVELNMPALAQANLEKLNVLCPNSCEEAEQLQSFIAGTAVK